MDKPVNIHDAKTHLSRLVERVEAGEEITLARAGRPVAKLVPYVRSNLPRQPGLWRGLLVVPEDVDAMNNEISELFEA